MKLLAFYFLIILARERTDGWIIPTSSRWANYKSLNLNSKNHIDMIPALNMTYHEWQFSNDEHEGLLSFDISFPAGKFQDLGRHVSTESSRGGGEDLFFDDELDKERWQRLARYLVLECEEILVGRNVAVIGSSWISFLSAQLGASRVMVCDEEYKDSKFQSHLRTFKMESKNYPSDSCNERCQIQFMDTLEMESFDAEVILLTSRSPNLINDPFVNDVLRRTDAPIFMDLELIDEFCYHARIQEGANITLW